MQELESSAQSVPEFAAAHGFHASTVYAWRRRARAGEPVRRGGWRGGRGNFSAEERRAALEAWSKSGMTAIGFSKLWGVSPESLRGWRARYELGGPQALEPKQLGRPSGAGRSTLPAPLQAEIVRTKRRFPSFGLKKVRDFLKRFQGQAVSTGSVRKVLKAEGLHALPVAPRRKRREIVRRFERSKPGELWQTDITSYVLTRSRVRVYLTVFLDDFSRYVVSWSLATHQKSQLVCEALMEGIERFGKPEEVLSDQGRQYFAWRGKSDFQRLLVREGIQHVVSRTHHPETLGKCERLWETVGVELWERSQPQDLGEARERLGHYFAHYNHFRPHQGIQGLVPADRFFGAEDVLRKSLEARMERDELGAALSETPRKSVYVFGQIGDQQVSLHGERGRIVLVTSDGVQKELALEDLGLPQTEKPHEAHERSDAADDDDGPGAHAAREEAPGLPAAQDRAELGAEPMGVGGVRGEGAGARDVGGGALDVAGAQDARAGGGGARATAAAGVAAQPGGALGYARGPTEAAPGSGQGTQDGGKRGGSACAEEAHSRAGGGEPRAEGAPGSLEGPAVREGTARATPPQATDGEAWQQEARGTAWS
ncbi:MAG: DDE-type integrase/transposase/recombinase [Planctomycetes bacterium]|nr:DDE-type integrase/transposase/recombinase [Planctomycetota bacterium]